MADKTNNEHLPKPFLRSNENRSYIKDVPPTIRRFLPCLYGANLSRVELPWASQHFLHDDHDGDYDRDGGKDDGDEDDNDDNGNHHESMY